MPSITIELSAYCMDELAKYARRHQLPLDEVILRAVDRFLAFADDPTEDVVMMPKECDLADTGATPAAHDQER